MVQLVEPEACWYEYERDGRVNVPGEKRFGRKVQYLYRG